MQAHLQALPRVFPSHVSCLISMETTCTARCTYYYCLWCVWLMNELGNLAGHGDLWPLARVHWLKLRHDALVHRFQHVSPGRLPRTAHHHIEYFRMNHRALSAGHGVALLLAAVQKVWVAWARPFLHILPEDMIWESGKFWNRMASVQQASRQCRCSHDLMIRPSFLVMIHELVVSRLHQAGIAQNL
jgi:hypothetical protein